MMGNEFSGNGCRAACFSLLNMKDGITSFMASGSEKPIYSSLKNSITTVDVPYSFTPNKRINNSIGFLINQLKSYQLVIEGFGSYSQAKDIIIQNFSDYSAAGVMYISRVSANKYLLDPYFWVKKTKTTITINTTAIPHILAETPKYKVE